MEEKKLLWIIPAYNEAKSLDAVVEDILSVDPKADYIIVSDGSTDGTVELCQKKGYSYLALPENLGLTACFQTGMRYADQRGFAYALQFDGDGHCLRFPFFGKEKRRLFTRLRFRLNQSGYSFKNRNKTDGPYLWTSDLRAGSHSSLFQRTKFLSGAGYLGPFAFGGNDDFRSACKDSGKTGGRVLSKALECGKIYDQSAFVYSFFWKYKNIESSEKERNECRGSRKTGRAEAFLYEK